jgi:hypothetical protein
MAEYAFLCRAEFLALLVYLISSRCIIDIPLLFQEDLCDSSCEKSIAVRDSCRASMTFNITIDITKKSPNFYLA